MEATQEPVKISNKDKTFKPSFTPCNGKRYAITISPCPSNYEGAVYYNPNFQMKVIIPRIFKVFKHIGSLELYPELNEKGFLHFHGFIWLKDKIKLYKEKIRINTEIGFICLRDLDGSNSWMNYIMKDYDNMFEYFVTTLKTIDNIPITPMTWSNYETEKKVEKKKLKLAYKTDSIGTFCNPETYKSKAYITFHSDGNED